VQKNATRFDLAQLRQSALRDMLRVLDRACQQIEHDHKLDVHDVKRRRVQLGGLGPERVSDI
jgi:hypothetical protein